MHQLEHVYYVCIYMHWRLDVNCCKCFSLHLAIVEVSWAEFVTDGDDTQNMYALGDSAVYT